jgi:hypothetical protein
VAIGLPPPPPPPPTRTPPQRQDMATSQGWFMLCVTSVYVMSK